MIDLKTPVKRKLKIGHKEFMVTISLLGIQFREKGARSSGVLTDWNKVLMSAYSITHC